MVKIDTLHIEIGEDVRHNLPRRIIYTRHPQCLHNVDHEGAIRKGIANRVSPLTPAGELQRDITAQYLRREFPDIRTVFCSSYSRTWTIPIAAGFEDIMSKSALLDERNMGVWHTHVKEDVLALHPDEDGRYKATSYYEYAAPGGESCTAVEDRLSEFLFSGALGAPETTVYISGHGISGLCLRRLLTKASVEDWHSWYSTPEDRLPNASVTVFEREGDVYRRVKNVIPWEGMIDPNLLVKKSVEA